MDWKEEVLALEEIKQTYEKLYGWKNPNGGRPAKNSLSSNEFSQEKLAEQINISQTKISQDLQLAKAIKKYPEIRKSKNKKSAYAKLREIQRQIQINQALVDSANTISEKVSLFCGDFHEIADKIEPNTIQLILTDPPYSENFLSLWENLADFAEKVLVPGGFLISYAPHFHLPVIFEKLAKKLQYFWIIALILPQHRLIHSRHVFCDWKPLLIFNKSPIILPQFFGDILKGSGLEKDLHEWQQAEKELEPIIENFCPPNGIVLDPMAGTGTTLVAALKLERKCIGIEKIAENFEIIKKRLSKQ